ncbi:class I SAM-dependent methyltransferase [Streptomyces catenulae]|uniref:Methyltransferase domain-containing protein n=1 Tax=Streptomyces catenulae TaxID=66875 RepID=A0ABV2Z127_9ACTN|nr:class I SAM-dependent methyltransferase [Streptomyces catenulae]
MTAQYDDVAGRMAEVDRTIRPYRNSAEIPAVLGAVGGLAGAAVLDAGCGSGAYTRLLRRSGAAEVVGVDASPAMVAVARAAEEREPLGITYEAADLVDLVAGRAFDLATAVSVLHYADTGRALCRMCERLFAHLRPGGHLVTVVGNADLPSGAVRDVFSIDRPEPVHDGDSCTLSIHATPPIHLAVRHWSRGAYHTALHTGGFTDITFTPIGPWKATPGTEPLALLLCARRPEP